MAKISLPDPYPLSLRYGVSVLVASAAVVFSFWLTGHHVGVDSAVMLAAVTFAAWFGGAGAGLVSFAIGFIAQLFMRYPEGSWIVKGGREQVGLLAFAVNALVICYLFRDFRVFRAWRKVAPGAVTGGWWWIYDANGDGTVELSSPAFPHLSVSRPYGAWLQQVHPDDRERVEDSIRNAMEHGRVDMEFHMVLPSKEVRRVCMSGLRFDRRVQGLTAVCLEIGASAPDPQAF